jgi:hypothetical protein
MFVEKCQLHFDAQRPYVLTNSLETFCQSCDDSAFAEMNQFEDRCGKDADNSTTLLGYGLGKTVDAIDELKISKNAICQKHQGQFCLSKFAKYYQPTMKVGSVMKMKLADLSHVFQVLAVTQPNDYFLMVKNGEGMKEMCNHPCTKNMIDALIAAKKAAGPNLKKNMVNEVDNAVSSYDHFCVKNAGGATNGTTPK